MTIRDNEALYNEALYEALYEELCRVETELSQINHEHDVIVAKHKCETYKLNDLIKNYGDDTFEVKHKKLIIEKLCLSLKQTVLFREQQLNRVLEFQSRCEERCATMTQKSP